MIEGGYWLLREEEKLQILMADIIHCQILQCLEGYANNDFCTAFFFLARFLSNIFEISW